MTETASELVDAEDPPLGTPYRARLLTVDDVRVEMARVYREVRAKTLTTADGTKLIYMLAQLGRVTEVVRVERKLDEMVELMKKAGITYVPDA